MCAADATLEVATVTGSPVDGLSLKVQASDAWKGVHQCRDFGQLVKYAEDLSVDNVAYS